MAKSESVRVRKIANGFIVEHCSMDDKGGYSSSEHYMEEPPKIAAPWSKPKPAAPADPLKLAASSGKR